jgi:hypothetical protein
MMVPSISEDHRTVQPHEAQVAADSMIGMVPKNSAPQPTAKSVAIKPETLPGADRAAAPGARKVNAEGWCSDGR